MELKVPPTESSYKVLGNGTFNCYVDVLPWVAMRIVTYMRNMPVKVCREYEVTANIQVRVFPFQ